MPSQALPDHSHAVRGPHRLVADLRVRALDGGELLVEGQGLLQELALERRQCGLLRQPLLGHLGVHLVDGLAGLLALEPGLGQGHGGRVLGPDGPDRLPDADGRARRPGRRRSEPTVVRAARLRRANFANRYRADGGHASTGSSVR